MTTGFYAAVVAILLVFAWRFQRRIAALGRAVLGPGCRVRYVQQRWVIEGTVEGRTVRYTTGTLGLFPALTYLYVEAPVRTGFSVVGDEPATDLPAAAAQPIARLRARDGFKRLDVFDGSGMDVAVLGRVTWLNPGRGIMLRRYTTAGGEADFVGRDLADLMEVVEALGAAGGVLGGRAAA